MGGPWEHNRWRWAYAYGACGWWAPAPPEDCDHWSPDLQARADTTAEHAEICEDREWYCEAIDP